MNKKNVKNNHCQIVTSFAILPIAACLLLTYFKPVLADNLAIQPQNKENLESAKKKKFNFIIDKNKQEKNSTKNLEKLLQNNQPPIQNNLSINKNRQNSQEQHQEKNYQLEISKQADKKTDGQKNEQTEEQTEEQKEKINQSQFVEPNDQKNEDQQGFANENELPEQFAFESQDWNLFSAKLEDESNFSYLISVPQNKLNEDQNSSNAAFLVIPSKNAVEISVKNNIQNLQKSAQLQIGDKIFYLEFLNNFFLDNK
jgi:hypothetical protein